MVLYGYVYQKGTKFVNQKKIPPRDPSGKKNSTSKVPTYNFPMAKFADLEDLFEKQGKRQRHCLVGG